MIIISFIYFYYRKYNKKILIAGLGGIGGDIATKLKNFLPDIKWVSKQRMLKEWDAKLYIHNTPHCIAAFYGYLHNCEYVHEVLEMPDIRDTIVGVIDEVLQTLKIVTKHDHGFLE